MVVNLFSKEIRTLMRRILHRLGVAEEDSEDVCQETLVAIHEKQAQIAAASCPRAYISGICRNKGLDWIRRTSRRRKRMQSLELMMSAIEQALAQTHAEQALAMIELADELDHIDRVIFERHCSGQEIKEIAAALGLPADQIRRRRRKVKALAQERLTNARVCWFFPSLGVLKVGVPGVASLLLLWPLLLLLLYDDDTRTPLVDEFPNAQSTLSSPASGIGDGALSHGHWDHDVRMISVPDAVPPAVRHEDARAPSAAPTKPLKIQTPLPGTDRRSGQRRCYVSADALLKRALWQLGADRPLKALDTLSIHERCFPRSSTAQQREQLRVYAYCKLDDVEASRATAAKAKASLGSPGINLRCQS